MKIIINILTILLLSMFLIGCATQTDRHSRERDLIAEQLENSEVEGYVLSLQPIENENGTYIYSIRNVGLEPMTLHFSSTQKYDYSIKYSNGEELYRFGFNHSFAQILSEEVIQPDEAFEMVINIQENLNELSAGTYYLDVWLTANNLYATLATELVIE